MVILRSFNTMLLLVRLRVLYHDSPVTDRSNRVQPLLSYIRITAPRAFGSSCIPSISSKTPKSDSLNDPLPALRFVLKLLIFPSSFDPIHMKIAIAQALWPQHLGRTPPRLLGQNADTSTNAAMLSTIGTALQRMDHVSPWLPTRPLHPRSSPWSVPGQSLQAV